MKPDQWWLLGCTLFKVVLALIPLMLAVAYLTFAERKIIGYMQHRIGPNRVGWHGCLQPIADALKLLLKEIIIPSASNRYLYLIAPMLAIAPTLVAWSVIPIGSGLVLADIPLGGLFILSMTSLGVYGIILAGWSSHSRYALLGAMRSAAQVISYELAMSMAVLGVVLASGELNLSAIVEAQRGGFWHWYWLPLFPLFIIYWISAVAETNRSPFDVVEGESEIVAGFHVEYAGMAFALFFLAEYANMILVSALATLFFLGGWLPPVEGLFGWSLDSPLNALWFFAKLSFFLLLYLWFRATFPRYRYDQIMRLGWKLYIPIAFVWLCVVVVMIVCGVPPWFS